VNDLVADVDRWTVLLERTLDDLDRADNACTKPARLREKNFNWTSFSQFAPYALFANSIWVS
jgi:hypothetical protein